MSEKITKFEDVIKRVEEMRKSGTVDLSTEEDLSIAIMNLLGIEEHLFFTGEKTGKDEYFDVLNEVRTLRTKLLKRMIDKTEGETWCISKHLLASSYRLMEVGTKFLAEGKKELAKEFFDDSYKMYSIFFALRLKVLDICQIKDMSKEEEAKPWKLQDIVAKLVDCCNE